jgi:hypothetical protein
MNEQPGNVLRSPGLAYGSRSRDSSFAIFSEATVSGPAIDLYLMNRGTRFR